MSDRFFCRKCATEARFNERLGVSYCPIHGLGFEIVRAPDPALTGQRTLDRATAARTPRLPIFRSEEALA